MSVLGSKVVVKLKNATSFLNGTSRDAEHVIPIWPTKRGGSSIQSELA